MTLTPFGPGIWTADGPEVAIFGFRYPTRMAVIRLAHGGLFIWSPVRLTEELRAATDSLGQISVLAAPNDLHDLFLAEWRASYPSARLVAPPRLRRKRKDLAIDGDLGDGADPAWAAEIDQVVIRGNAITTEVAFFHKESRTVLFTDLLQQFPEGWFRGWRAVVARLDLMTAPEPSVPRKFRLAFTNRRAARAAIEKVHAWPAENVIMAHGAPVIGEGAAFLRRAFAWLTG